MITRSHTMPSLQTSPTMGTVAHAPHASAAHGRLVTDAPTRMFHWLFALSFLGAYLTAEGDRWRLLHVTLGYTLAGLLVFRVLYGLLGPRQAGLGLMWRKLSGAPAWLRTTWGVLRGRSGPGIHWRQAQNLLMALAVVAMMAVVVPVTLSGYATYNDWGDVLGGDWLGEVHEVLGNAFLFIVLAHLALILGLSVWRRKNQALPMLTGRVEGSGPHLVKHNRSWLAVVLLFAVLAYGGWEWQQSPDGLIPTSAWSSIGSHDHGHRHERSGEHG
jgi:cytochrome b